MTEVEKMENGFEYCFTDRELGARRRNAIATIERYNQIPALDFAEQERFVASSHAPRTISVTKEAIRIAGLYHVRGIGVDIENAPRYDLVVLSLRQGRVHFP